MLEDLGNIADLIAAIATIATLGYLAFQVKQNTKALRGSSAETVMESEIAAVALTTQHINVFRRGNDNISELNADERAVYDQLIFIEISQTWSAFTQYQSGLMSEVTFAAFRTSWVRSMRNPGFRISWAEQKKYFRRIFADASTNCPLPARVLPRFQIEVRGFSVRISTGVQFDRRAQHWSRQA
ncbi:MAG: hypothetical protein IH881_11450 [Myxococcales bacterium]|nr:hypothetical protein [Myxococcales bacterium]